MGCVSCSLWLSLGQYLGQHREASSVCVCVCVRACERVRVCERARVCKLHTTHTHTHTHTTELSAFGSLKRIGRQLDKSVKIFQKRADSWRGKSGGQLAYVAEETTSSLRIVGQQRPKQHTHTHVRTRTHASERSGACGRGNHQLVTNSRTAETKTTHAHTRARARTQVRWRMWPRKPPARYE